MSELALAKRLADSNDDTDKEVQRWRFVVRRAGAKPTAEPNRENIKRIAEVFGADIKTLGRPMRRKTDSEDRLQSVEGDVVQLREAVNEGLTTQELILGRLKALEAAVRSLGGVLESPAVGDRTAPQRSQRTAG